MSVTVAALALGALAALVDRPADCGTTAGDPWRPHRIAEGDLSHDMAVDRRDELGQLQRQHRANDPQPA